MALKIGEVSKLLNISIDSIRFYEDHEIITPKRDECSGYRLYEPWDIFFLMDCIKYRSFGLAVKDIAKMLHSESISYYVKKLNIREKEIMLDMERNTLLYDRIRKFKEDIETIHLNQGHFWFKKIPPQMYYVYSISYGDDYSDLDINDCILANWLDNLPFTEYGVHISVEDLTSQVNVMNRWSCIIEKRLFDILNIKKTNETKEVPEQLCLCTVINIGKKGQLSFDLFKPFLDYVETIPYEITGDLIGKLLVRLNQKGSFCRFVEAQLPVRMVL
ncbi:MAG: MerR family transcriptional regulator [Clostridiaceae bacterium]|jgi:DNA-binding transcriptional MerR regulator|nr:MerR family transcriptional regulator [Clostridiaceae bacterium]